MFNDYQQQPSSSPKIKTSLCCFNSSVHDHQPLKSEDKPWSPSHGPIAVTIYAV